MRTTQLQPSLYSCRIALWQNLLALLLFVFCSLNSFTNKAFAQEEPKKEFSISLHHDNGLETQIEVFSAQDNLASANQLAELIQKEISYSEANNIPSSYASFISEDNERSAERSKWFNRKLKSKKSFRYITVPKDTIYRHKAAKTSLNQRINSTFSIFRMISNGAVVGLAMYKLGNDIPWTVAASVGATTGLISGAFQVFNQQYLDWQSYHGIFRVDKSKPTSATEYVVKYWVKEATVFLGLIAIVKHVAAHLSGMPITFDPMTIAFGIFAGATASTAFQGSYTAIIKKLRNLSLDKTKYSRDSSTGRSKNIVFDLSNNITSQLLSPKQKKDKIEKITLKSNFSAFTVSVVSVAITVPVATTVETISEQVIISAMLSTLGIPAMIYLYKTKKKISDNDKSDASSLYNDYLKLETSPAAHVNCLKALSLK